MYYTNEDPSPHCEGGEGSWVKHNKVLESHLKKFNSAMNGDEEEGEKGRRT